MPPRPHTFYEFGPFRLDTVNARLLRDEQPIRLTPKVFNLLLVLVQNQGRMLERDELLNNIWSEAIVEESNLTQGISILRRSLGCGQNGQRYIETIPKRGYRFVAPVREFDYEEELIIQKHARAELVIEEDEPAPATTAAEAAVGAAAQTIEVTPVTGKTAASPATTALRTILAQRKILAAGTALLVLLAAAVAWRLSSNQRGKPDWREALQTSQLVGSKGERSGPLGTGKFSPDGAYIAYSVGRDVYVLSKGGRKTNYTEGQGYNWSPVWSPDGKRIAFLSDRGNQQAVWVIDRDEIAPNFFQALEGNAVSLCRWTPNDRLYFAADNNFYYLDLRTLQITQLTTFDPPKQAERYFDISPDERWIAFTDRRDDQYNVWYMAATGGDPVQVTHDKAYERTVAWHPDSERLIFSSGLDSRLRVYSENIVTKQREQITLKDEDCLVYDVACDGSPDKTRILLSGQKDESDLWSADIGTGEERQITSDIGMEFWPTASADSGRIAAQVIGGERSLWYFKRARIIAFSTKSKAAPTLIAEDGFNPEWSPDGQSVAFLRLTDQPDAATGEVRKINTLWVASASGGQERLLIGDAVYFGGQVNGLSFNLFLPKSICWAPDSRRLAYSSRKDGALNLWVVAADGTGDRKITNNTDPAVDLMGPIWSPDGTRITYFTEKWEKTARGVHLRAERQIWVTDLQLSTKVLHSEKPIRLLGWANSPGRLLFAVGKDELLSATTEVQIKEVAIADGVEKLIGLVKAAYLTNVFLSPDKKIIAYVGVSDGKDNLWTLPVGAGEAKQITRNINPHTYFSSLTWTADSRSVCYAKQERWQQLIAINNFN